MSRPVRSAVIISGSPRPKGTSTSEMLAREVARRLDALGIGSSTWPVTKVFRETPTFDRLRTELDTADLWVLIFPVYVDALPYPLTALLEHLHAHPPVREPPPRLLAIANCGFPEAEHTRVARRICERFAAQSGLEWLGSLGLGGGESLHGAALDAHPGMTQSIREALDLTVAAVARGEPVPEAAVHLMAKPLLLPPLYRWAGAAGWVIQSLERRSLLRLWARPFEARRPR